MPEQEDVCSLRWNPAAGVVEIIDQTLLPYSLQWCELRSLESFRRAICDMQVRGAPLIGITAAFGLALAVARDPSDGSLRKARAELLATRPTAVDLAWALQSVEDALAGVPETGRPEMALREAQRLRADSIANCARIGDNGLELLLGLATGGRSLNVMTHCNAGWLATVRWGTALAPVYRAHARGIPVHVWVSETRPRNQGTSLTAWELARAGVPCTVVADSACGHLLQRGAVDCVLVGSDRVAANGDVCNKIGTYLKALAARAAGVPFYAAMPRSTVDPDCPGGMEIPIEERDPRELLVVTGCDAGGAACEVRLAEAGSRAANPAFDVTPAELVTALITEHGVSPASPEGVRRLMDR